MVNFANVTSCGTNTEVSLPCMFAPVGRRDYDEARIRGSESLLHVLARAGVGGALARQPVGLQGRVRRAAAATTVHGAQPGRACAATAAASTRACCAAWTSAARRAGAAAATQLLVLHQLGSHGPAYFRRYPPAFAHFTPACDNDDLQQCTRDEIVNAYDNSLLYTDHVLASLIAACRRSAPTTSTRR